MASKKAQYPLTKAVDRAVDRMSPILNGRVAKSATKEAIRTSRSEIPGYVLDRAATVSTRKRAENEIGRALKYSDSLKKSADKADPPKKKK